MGIQALKPSQTFIKVDRKPHRNPLRHIHSIVVLHVLSTLSQLLNLKLGIMKKLSETYQKKWINNHLYNDKIINNIDASVQLHKDIKSGVSSAAACINVLGNLSKPDLLNYLNRFNLNIDEIFEFPNQSNVGGEVYNDKGFVVFEWIGPKKSPIFENRGKRGSQRTSVDGFVIAKIDNKLTQIFIEWKFTETYTSIDEIQKFAGLRGNERLKRYSSCLAKLRNSKDFPFRLNNVGGIGLYDFGYEPFYQLLRMTLLAKMTTPIMIGKHSIQDYRILHITHSDNSKLNILSKSNIKFCPGLINYQGKNIHEVWLNLLSDYEKNKFRSGYWNQSLDLITDNDLKNYLIERYK